MTFQKISKTNIKIAGAPTLPNASQFFKTQETESVSILEQIDTDTNTKSSNYSPTLPAPSQFLEAQETESASILEQINPEPNISEDIFTLGYKITPLIGIIVMVILLIKSINNKKEIMENISLEVVNHVQTKSIILLVLSVISCSPIALILTIISTIFIYKTKQQFDTDFEMAKSKLNIASTLNIISIVLIVIGFTLLIFMLFPILIQLSRISTMTF